VKNAERPVGSDHRAILGDRRTDEGSDDEDAKIGVVCQVRSPGESCSVACRSPSPDLSRSLPRSSGEKEVKRRNEREQQGYVALLLSSVSDDKHEGSPTRVGSEVHAGDRGSWCRGLKIPVLEPTSVPLGNIIEANEWIKVCRRHRHGGPPSAMSLAKVRSLLGLDPISMRLAV
jgi:hypothetical protein